MKKILVPLAAIVLGLFAVTLFILITVGVILPGEWDLEREIHIEAEPETVYSLLDSLGAWDSWAAWGEVESTFSGPSRGVGAERIWDDRRLGDGALLITDAKRPSALSYEVAVEGGSIQFTGTFNLFPSATGTRVHWRESADFGWNPLLGWTALMMDESQLAQMDSSLVRLKAVAER